MDRSTHPQSLIRTKLYRPRSFGTVIARPQLLARLDQRRPLTLVVAPAGYGKTTLLGAWLSECDLPSAWLSLDERDNDPLVFIEYLVAAVRTVFPDALPATLDTVNSTSPPPITALAQILGDELDALGRPFVLVLDDYHALADERIHSLVAGLLPDPPLPMRLVLTTRHDPPFPLARLNARDHVTVIRAGDLRFTLAETRALLDSMIEEPIDDETLAALAAKTEGWPAGIYLVAMFMRRQAGARPGSLTPREIDAYTLDYLATEVLAHQSQDVQEMLLKTSIVDRVCDALSAALLGPATGGPRSVPSLARLEQQNLFVVALDEEGTWFRFHHLFRQLLLRQLGESASSEEIAALHGRASAWFAAHGLAEEALHHALTAGDTTATVQIVTRYRHDLINREEWRTLQRWLRLFPRRVVEEQPVLLVTEGWLLMSQGQVRGYSPLLARIDALIVNQTTSPTGTAGDQAATPAPGTPETQAVGLLRTEADILRSELLWYAGQLDEVIPLAQRVLTGLPKAWQLARSYQMLILAGAYQMAGDLPHAYAVLDDGLREQHADTEILHVRLAVSRCLISWLAGDLPDMLAFSGRYRAAAERLNMAESVGWAHYFAGCAHYHRNELAEAEAHFRTVVQNPYGVNGNTFANASCALALTRQMQGQPDQARTLLDTAIDFLTPTNQICLGTVEAFRAELALHLGDLATAERWAARNLAGVPLQPAIDFFAPQLVLPKILLAQDTSASRARAGELLGHQHDFFASIHSTRFLIEVLAVQSLLHTAERDTPAAILALEQAIRLAEPGGFIRLFADLGPRLDPLLARLARRGVAPAYVARIRAALRQPAPAAVETARATAGASIVQHGQGTDRWTHPALAEALTRREMDVLRLLMQRLTNKEIAHELGIAPETVKRHTIAIFAKLGVDNRRAAIERARGLGLVPAI